MKIWGKEITKTEAEKMIEQLKAEIYSIEHSEAYVRYSDAGDDRLWYQIEAKMDEIAMLADEFGLKGYDEFY